MAFIFFDDSKHHNRGFSLAAMVVCDADPDKTLKSAISDCGFSPRNFEFKSSLKMQNNAELQLLREKITHFMQAHCKIAICIVSRDEFLGEAGLSLLEKAIEHKDLNNEMHHIYFDEGFFRSKAEAHEKAEQYKKLQNCNFHFEQDSRQIRGIQIADLVAHTCAIVLSDALGFISKKIEIDYADSGYIDVQMIELGFLLWASIRYNFLGTNMTDSMDPNDDDFGILNVEPYGLFVHHSAGKLISKAAHKRFGKMYLGCIH